MRLNTGTQAAVGVGVGAGALLAWWAWRRASANQMPSEWEEVGQVSRLNLYPLKSGRPVSVEEAEATVRGLVYGTALDRSFLVMKKGGVLLTGRQAPKLTTVSVRFERDGERVVFSAQESEVGVNLTEVEKAGEVVELSVFGANAKGFDCGDEVAQWMSRIIYDGETEVRILFNGDLTQRKARRAPYYDFRHIRDSDKVTYADTCAYMLASESSLADLNSRLEKPVTIDWFRPNLIVSGTKAYDEDDWAFVRIGDVVFRRLKPCDRCIFTIVDPSVGAKTEDQEPITTLKKYRLLDGPEQLVKAWAVKPVFGSHMGIDICGKVKVGDKVLVARASKNSRWNY